MPDTREVWYRIEDYRHWVHEDLSRPALSIRKLPVIKHTPKGVWLDIGYDRRFVLKDAHKRYACPTFEEAKASFKARKKRQLRILRAQAAHVEGALELLEQGEPDYVPKDTLFDELI